MKTFTIAALTALLSTGALAVPLVGHGHDHKAPAHGHMHARNKRDIIWVTEWEVETVVVMKTVYDDGVAPPSEPTDVATTTILADAPAATNPAAATSSPASPAEAGSSPEPAYTSPVTSTGAPTTAPAPTTTTSVYVAPAPAPTTEAATTPAPAPTTYVAPAPAPSSTTSAAAPAPPTSGQASGGASYTGDATYWEPALGACGWTNTADEMVVAISMIQFDPQTPSGNPNNNKLCGKFVNIKTADGSSVSAKVVDRCVGCAIGDLDMTKALFDKVTNNGDGRVGGMQWSWA